MDQGKIDFKWMSCAWITALMSKDPSTKVGAVIVSSDNRQCSVGYNGFPVGVEETPQKWERPLKYEYVQHAEPNAIANCPFDTYGCTIYITHMPCHRCLGHIRNSGIKHIVYNLGYDRLGHREVWNDIALVFDSIRQMDRDIRQEIISKLQDLN